MWCGRREWHYSGVACIIINSAYSANSIFAASTFQKSLRSGWRSLEIGQTEKALCVYYVPSISKVNGTRSFRICSRCDTPGVFAWLSIQLFEPLLIEPAEWVGGCSHGCPHCGAGDTLGDLPGDVIVCQYDCVRARGGIVYRIVVCLPGLCSCLVWVLEVLGRKQHYNNYMRTICECRNEAK